MNTIHLLKALIVLRLTYYRMGILERLRRFKLLIFFILAMIVPTVAFMMQLIQIGSAGLMNGAGHPEYFMGVIVFQLLIVIWVGSQYELLKIPDVENYLRTLKISDLEFFFVELLFSFIVNLPFIAFLLVGMFSLAQNDLMALRAAHFVYLLSSLVFLSFCLVYSRAFISLILLITDFLFIHLNGLIPSIVLSLLLLSSAYFLLIQKRRLPFSIHNPLSTLEWSRFFPNIYLNLKSLFCGNRVYTACILAIDLLVLFIFILYTLAKGKMEQSPLGFLMALTAMMFFCSLLSYKLSETRNAYGSYFLIFYNKLNYYFFDLISIYWIVLFHFVMMLFVGLYFSVPIFIMLKAMVIASISVILFVSLNRQFPLYGPVLSLLTSAGILVMTRGFL